MTDIAVSILNALTLISVLALVALGLAVVLGMMDVINLAHGEMLTIGAYVLAVTQMFLPPGPSYLAALLLAPVVGGAAGWALERLLISRLYSRPLDAIVVTFGVSLVVQKCIEVGFGTLPQVVDPPMSGTLEFFGVVYPAYRLIMISIAVVVICAVAAVFRYSAFGVNLRAVIQNRSMAEALGIDAAWHTRAAFALGGGLAALAGVLVAPLASVDAHLGTFYLTKAFFVVILGGLGSVFGSVAGSTFVGGLETALNYYITPSLASALVLLLAIVVIRFRPQGIATIFTWRRVSK